MAPSVVARDSVGCFATTIEPPDGSVEFPDSTGYDTDAMSKRRPFLLRAGYRLLQDLLALVRLGLTSLAHLAAETLFLRKQLALYRELPVA